MRADQMPPEQPDSLAGDHVDAFIHELRALCDRRAEEILTPDDITYSLRLVADEIDIGEINPIRNQ